MLAVFKREFKSYFTNPLGFVILAIFYFLLGYLFSGYYSMGAPYVEYAVLGIAQILLIVVPAITMRLFSDERRTKTDQVLFTAPVKLINIVLGKFFAALALYALGFVPTIIYQIIVSAYVSVNIFYYIYALVGILLFGAALIAIGMFISSLAESPITSIIFTLVVNVFIMISGGLANLITVPSATTYKSLREFIVALFTDFLNACEFVWAQIVQLFADFIGGMNFLAVLDSFGNQAFSVKDVVYFISITVAFIFLTERSLEKRRWS